MEITMKSYGRHLIVLSLFTIIAMVYGCASVPQAPVEKTTVESGGNYNPPSWVNKGSGAFKDADGIKVIYGVGVADGIKSLSLQRVTADDRAIANLATQMNAVVKRLKKDYESLTASGESSIERRNIDNAMKVIVNETVSGSQIIDHWEHPGKNALYSLARVQLQTFTKQIESNKELSEKSRSEIKKKAENIHKEMTKDGL